MARIFLIKLGDIREIRPLVPFVMRVFVAYTKCGVTRNENPNIASWLLTSIQQTRVQFGRQGLEPDFLEVGPVNAMDGAAVPLDLHP